MTEEEKKILAERMALEIYKNKRIAAAERFNTPLCHSFYHPYLGNGVFKDTCPDCGYKKE